MVLSNKKLKQKLRSLLAESAVATESKEPLRAAANKDVDEQLQSIKELLTSKSRKPRISKREKRRKEPLFSEDSKPIQESQETEKGNGESVVDAVGVKKEKKSKKRKREGEGEDKGPAEKKSAKKKKQKKKKKKKDKIKAEKKENEEKEGGKSEKGIDGINGASNAKEVEVSVKIDESEIKKVYVGGIPYYSSEDDIRSFFEGCGTVTEVDCMQFPETGRFRGIAILTFKTEAAAKRALALEGADMGGFYLKIQPFKANRAQKSDFAPEVVEGYNRVYVGNLSWDITEDHLKQLFSDCKVSTIRFGMDKESGEFKGYAHVDFSDSVSLAIALKLDQKEVCGRPARIRCAVPPKKGAVTNSGKKSGGNTAENSSSTAGNAKKKRRTCYECGVPGHLSSDCPRKKAAEVEGSAAKS